MTRTSCHRHRVTHKSLITTFITGTIGIHLIPQVLQAKFVVVASRCYA